MQKPIVQKSFHENSGGSVVNKKGVYDGTVFAQESNETNTQGKSYLFAIPAHVTYQFVQTRIKELQKIDSKLAKEYITALAEVGNIPEGVY